MNFDAVDIEHEFAHLIDNEAGWRGTDHDADMFRGENFQRIPTALKKAIDAIGSRVSAIFFAENYSNHGGIKARLTVAIKQLRSTATAMPTSQATEPNDYHWAIVNCLISIIAALLDVVERQGAR